MEGNLYARLKPGQSHAWYDVVDYIIDIIYDHFEGTGSRGWVFLRGWVGTLSLHISLELPVFNMRATAELADDAAKK
jgi:hypothetical protein